MSAAPVTATRGAPAALPVPSAAATTAAPSTTTASTTSSPAPPAPTLDLAEPAATALVTASEADSFLRNYFDAVETRDYALSWSQLSPEFQRGKARSFDYYVEFWNENDIEVGDVGLVDADSERAFVDVELRWNGSTDAVTDRFELRRSLEGRLLIAGQD